MVLTGYQVQQLNEFMGGEYDTDVSIGHLPERTSLDGETMPAGLYVWCTDYPEEGAMLLDAEPVEQAKEG